MTDCSSGPILMGGTRFRPLVPWVTPAKVMIRIHRGYDGPSTVTFALKRPGEKTPEKSFTVTLFRRTGDAAFWR